MKKMLLIEEPESCETCPLRSYSNLMLMCTPMRNAASDVDCPLRPLPTRVEHEEGLDSAFNIGWEHGYNACLDDLGEKE